MLSKKIKEYKAIRLRGLDYILLEEDEGGGARKGIEGYTYLKHLIESWPSDWEDQLSNMNELIHDQIQHQKEEKKS